MNKSNIFIWRKIIQFNILHFLHGIPQGSTLLRRFRLNHPLQRLIAVDLKMVKIVPPQKVNTFVIFALLDVPEGFKYAYGEK